MSPKWKFKFRNLGPVNDASLELRDLTIITGRNNTGKTYMVYTLFGFLRDFYEIAVEIMEDWSNNNIFSNAISQSSEGMAIHLLKNGTLELHVPKKNLDNDRIQLIRQMAYRYSHNRLDGVFNAEPGTFSSASFDLEVNESPGEYKSLRSEIWSDSELSILHREDRLFFLLNNNKKQDTDSEADSLIQRYLLEHHLRRIYAHFLLQDRIFRAVTPHCITSVRLAISLFHAELESNRRQAIRRLQQEEQVVREDDGAFLIHADLLREMSRYPLPINDEIDFVKNVPDIPLSLKKPHETSPSKDIVEMMEGHYAKENNKTYFISSQGHSPPLPLHLASSSATEMSNLFFFFVTEDSRRRLLIIDEPESHLDPVNQIKFARALVRWVNSGTKILISTHSDYIIKEINNLIMLNSDFEDKSKVIERLEYKDSIEPGIVKAYVAKNGTLIECDIDKYGIDMPHFDNTIDNINAVSNELTARLSAEEEDW